MHHKDLGMETLHDLRCQNLKFVEASSQRDYEAFCVCCAGAGDHSMTSFVDSTPKLDFGFGKGGAGSS